MSDGSKKFEEDPFKNPVNENSKSQLRFLLTLVDSDELRLWEYGIFDNVDSVKLRMKILGKIAQGTLKFESDVLYQIAIDSLNLSDREVAKKYNCNLITISVARLKLMASIISLIPKGIDIPLALNDEIMRYLDDLSRYFESRHRSTATLIAFNRSYNPVLRNFFLEYAGCLVMAKVFRKADIKLSEEEGMYYDKVMRCFLNPDLSDEKAKRGMETMLRRYIFALIARDLISVVRLEVAVKSVMELGLSVKDKGYSPYIKIREIFPQGVDVNEKIRKIAWYISAKKDVDDLGHKFNSLARFIYNLYLLDIPDKNLNVSLYYLDALKLTPTFLVQRIRNRALGRES